jgi:hypothetical protein
MIPNLPKPKIVLDFSTKIFTKQNVLSHEECDELIDSQLSNLNSNNLYGKKFPSSFHACLLPLNHQIHDKLQPALQEMVDFLKFDIDFVEPYEFKKYTKSDYSSEHYDNYHFHKENIDRKITAVVFLSDYKTHSGGHLKILGRPHTVSKGSIIAFPSFFPHSVERIITGERYSLVAWLWGNYWK